MNQACSSEVWFGTMSRITRSPTSCASPDQRLGLAQRAERRVDVAVVGDVVAAVRLRRRVPRVDPDRVDAQRGDVRQPPADPGEVAEPVAVRVGEAADVELIGDGLAPPRDALAPVLVDRWLLPRGRHDGRPYRRGRRSRGETDDERTGLERHRLLVRRRGPLRAHSPRARGADHARARGRRHRPARPRRRLRSGDRQPRPGPGGCGPRRRRRPHRGTAGRRPRRGEGRPAGHHLPARRRAAAGRRPRRERRRRHLPARPHGHPGPRRDPARGGARPRAGRRVRRRDQPPLLPRTVRVDGGGRRRDAHARRPPLPDRGVLAVAEPRRRPARRALEPHPRDVPQRLPRRGPRRSSGSPSPGPSAPTRRTSRSTPRCPFFWGSARPGRHTPDGYASPFG